MQTKIDGIDFCIDKKKSYLPLQKIQNKFDTFIWQNKNNFESIFSAKNLLVKQEKEQICLKKELQKKITGEIKVELNKVLLTIKYLSTKENINCNSEQNLYKNLNSLFHSFNDTVRKIDTLFDIQTSSEKMSNKDLLDTNYNALILLIKNVESQRNTSPEIQNKINNIKLYLAKYYANEWSIENSNFTNYQLSNALAFDILWNIGWVGPVPKAPEMWDIISSFKWTWIGTYIITRINAWESESNIFSSKVVKDATEKNWEKLIELYEKNLEKYLELINESKRDKLSQVQKDALDLLLDVNWVGWGNLKNSNVNEFDLMGWDFAAIWVGIGTWFWAGALAWSIIPWAWTITLGTVWAVAWWITSTLWMMLNHWDNYFWEDWKKWWTELAINTTMFWAWWALFKYARHIQWWSKLLSWKWAMAMWAEATGDVAIWVSTDMTRWWAYQMDMDIELWDAIINNLVWALLPITLRGKQGFSEVRKKLAKNVSEWQKKASILARLWDKPWAKKIIDGLNNEIKNMKNGKKKMIYAENKVVDWKMEKKNIMYDREKKRTSTRIQNQVSHIIRPQEPKKVNNIPWSKSISQTAHWFINFITEQQLYGKVVDIPVNIIQPIHPVPRPKVDLSALRRKIEKEWYDKKQHITVLLLPNNDMILWWWHHRLEVMKTLKKNTIPWVIYNLSKNKSEMTDQTLSEYTGFLLKVGEFTNTYKTSYYPKLNASQVKDIEELFLDWKKNNWRSNEKN
jgi:hypothetical protein